jgi:16S rRNA (guanine527-N7)-methyltransferase
MGQFHDMLEQIGLSITPHQYDQFERYYQELIAWNKKLNLTSITDRDEVFLKHFYDSLSLVRAIPLVDQSLLDVGSGAGFPSIPLKILFPHLKVTILDAMQKRIAFLEHLTEALQIDVTLIHGRAEEFDQREVYDIVTARAVANLTMLSELCIPFVRPSGYFLAMKGPGCQDELDRSKRAIATLSAHIDDVVQYRIDHLNRCIVKVRKDSITPSQYPRRYKKIKSKPL